MPRYHVIHETRYDYDSPVSLSQQLLHQLPRVCAWQCCEQHRIDIDPQPSWARDGSDAFGNPVRWLCFDSPMTSWPCARKCSSRSNPTCRRTPWPTS